jgi:hypothetical protein
VGATLVVKETACLSIEDRAAVDKEMAADTGALPGMVTGPSSPMSAPLRTGGTRTRSQSALLLQ